MCLIGELDLYLKPIHVMFLSISPKASKYSEISVFLNTITGVKPRITFPKMAPILTVIGATGKQGASVVNAALQDGTYKVRAITRNINSEKAKAFAARGVELATADIDSEESLIKAFEVSRL